MPRTIINETATGDSTVVIVGLKEVMDTLYNVSNLVDHVLMQEVLWDMGQETKRQCQLMCDAVVYATPETRAYKRTGYLRDTIYVTQVGRSDWKESHASGYAKARAIYPKRQTAFTYRLGTITRPPSRREVKVTAGAIYAQYVEYGGNNNAGARPFMRAGSIAGESAIVSIGNAGIRRVLSIVSSGRAAGRARNARGQFI